ncbi:MAG: PadR family transcriptional regulator [Bacteroidota bacterium]|nr:PadR family transcriptional regulator [Bacteroidota bacterium]MDQ3534931.1 PadR family transcriptional regulator [Bacteroidota bacterium]
MNSTELIKGTLIPIILKLLSDNERMYGYEITQKVKELSGGKFLINEGSLYPALHKMLQDGLVNVEIQLVGKRVRKYYRLTEIGIEEKGEQFNELKNFINTIQIIAFPNAEIQKSC